MRPLMVSVVPHYGTYETFYDWKVTDGEREITGYSSMKWWATRRAARTAKGWERACARVDKRIAADKGRAWTVSR